MRLSILRHAPALTEGRLAGRRDVPADCSDHAALARVKARIGAAEQVICSPALRCRQTATALGLTWDSTDPALWEQDFGAWEGLPFDALPDLGPLETAQLARHRPPGGESFADLCARITPARRGPGGATGSDAGSAETPSAPASLASSRWARRLERVFGIDIASCLACGGRLRILACIEDRRTVDAILAHLARKAAEPERLASPHRVPPGRAPPTTTPAPRFS